MTLPSQARINVHNIKTLKLLVYRLVMYTGVCISQKLWEKKRQKESLKNLCRTLEHSELNGTLNTSLSWGCRLGLVTYNVEAADWYRLLPLILSAEDSELQF